MVFDTNVKTVRNYIFNGGLDGKVFVNSNGFPYIFLAYRPIEKLAGNYTIGIQYVSIGVHDIDRVRFGDCLGNREYDSKNVRLSATNDEILDEEFLRHVRLRGVGD